MVSENSPLNPSCMRIHYLAPGENLNQSDRALVRFANFSINNLPCVGHPSGEENRKEKRKKRRKNNKWKSERESFQERKHEQEMHDGQKTTLEGVGQPD